LILSCTIKPINGDLVLFLLQIVLHHDINFNASGILCSQSGTIFCDLQKIAFVAAVVKTLSLFKLCLMFIVDEL